MDFFIAFVLFSGELAAQRLMRSAIDLKVDGSSPAQNPCRIGSSNLDGGPKCSLRRAKRTEIPN